ncbi:MAG: hypothetical protein CMM07_07075 [Rhodopirellula sp.]|nr:hypothetical protein [Rhodopirellula sp.]
MRPQTRRENNAWDVVKWFEEFYSSFSSNDSTFNRVITAGFDRGILGRSAKYANRGTGVAHAVHRATGGDDYYKRREDNLKEVTQAIKLFAYKDPMDAVNKLAKLKSELKAHHGPTAELPQTFSLPDREIKQYQIKKDLLEIKIAVLRYWIDVHEGRIQPDYSDAVGSEHRRATVLKYHYLLQSDKDTVNTILKIMLEDANEIVQKPNFSLSTKAAFVLEGSKSYKVTKEFLNYAINADAAFKVGASWEGSLEVEYTGIKAKFEGNAFAGIRGNANVSAQANAALRSLNAEAGALVGIKLEGKATIDFDHLLNVELGGEAFAGALASAGAKLVINGEELDVMASAAVFAGVKLEGTATGKFKLGKPPITFATWTAKGTVSAGYGVNAHAKLKCDILGTIGFGAGAGATMGVGAEGGAEFELQRKELATACEQLYFDGLHKFGVTYGGYRHKIVPEANLAQAVTVIRHIAQLKTELALKQSEVIATMDKFDGGMDRLQFSLSDKRLTKFT